MASGGALSCCFGLACDGNVGLGGLERNSLCGGDAIFCKQAGTVVVLVAVHKGEGFSKTWGCLLHFWAGGVFFLGVLQKISCLGNVRLLQVASASFFGWWNCSFVLFAMAVGVPLPCVA